jgi:hypothetical protein
MATKRRLLESWRDAREAFKLDGHTLTPVEKAGLLIEQLGSVEAAARLAWVHSNVPMLVELERPNLNYQEGITDLLIEAWLAELGDRAPTRSRLLSLWNNCRDGLTGEPRFDAQLNAGGILNAVEDVDLYIQELGRSLYSPFHFVTGFAKDPLAPDVLFLLEVVRWQEKR